MRDLGVFVLLFTVIGITYINADHKDFVFDDMARDLISSPDVADLSTAVSRLFSAPWRADEQMARVTFAVNHLINRTLGLDPFSVTSFLAINILIHAVNAYLVYVLVRRLLCVVRPKAPPAAAMPLGLAVLFAVHPIHASTIAYIVQRRGELATLFYLLGVLAYLRFRGSDSAVEPAGRPHGQPNAAKRDDIHSGSTGPGRKFWWLLVVAVCYWLAIKSKSMAVTLPLTILAGEFCVRARDPGALRRYMRYLVPGLVLCGLVGLGFLWSIRLFDPAHLRILPQGTAGTHGVWAQFLTESRAFAQYWKLLLMPLPGWMCIDHQFDVSAQLTERHAWLALIFHGCMIAGALVAAIRGRTLAALGVMWFYATLLPYAIVPQTELLVEYKTYLPCIGFVLIIADVGLWMQTRVPVPPKAVGVLVLAAVLMITTIRRNVIYQDPVSFYMDAVAKYPRHARPHNNLGAVLAQAGRQEEAIAAYRQALAVDPNQDAAQANLGKMLAKQGRYQEAIVEYRKALALAPDDLFVRHSLGIALEAVGRIDDAIQCYNEILRREPSHRLALLGLGACFQQKGDFSAAAAAYRKVLAEDTANLDARCNLANCLLQTGKADEAIEECHGVLKLNPKSASAWYVLGNVHLNRGQSQEALDAYLQAVGLDPANADARLQYGCRPRAAGAYR